MERNKINKRKATTTKIIVVKTVIVVRNLSRNSMIELSTGKLLKRSYFPNDAYQGYPKQIRQFFTWVMELWIGALTV